MTWTTDQIKDLLLTNDEAVKRAVLALYRRQTSEEQDAQATIRHNGAGFNSNDGFILTSFAKQMLTKGFLSPKQVAFARKRVVKYTRQLVEEANIAAEERARVEQGRVAALDVQEIQPQFAFAQGA